MSQILITLIRHSLSTIKRQIDHEEATSNEALDKYIGYTDCVVTSHEECSSLLFNIIKDLFANITVSIFFVK